MNRGQLGVIFRRMQRINAAPVETDAELLARYARGEQSAFASLAERYSGLVWSVGRRILHTQHDAEDVMQAAFLALAQKCRSLKGEHSLAPWLYTVACRIAFDIKRRRKQEKHLLETAEPATLADPSSQVCGRELGQAFDEEMQRLPNEYREALVLCCLEGLSRDEAAAAAGCTLAMMKNRLERGRKLLRRRLERRGIAAPATLLIVGLASRAAPAAVCASACRALTTAPPHVVALAMHAIGGNLVMKAITVTIALGLTVFGIWALTNRLAEHKPAPATPTSAVGQAPQPANKEAKVEVATAPLDGAWHCVATEADGKQEPKWMVGAWRLNLSFAGANAACPRLFLDGATYSLPDTPPNAIDFHVKSPTGEPLVLCGIFVRDGNMLRLCLDFSDTDKGRPNSFTTAKSDGCRLLVFERVEPDQIRTATGAEQLGAVLEEAQQGSKLSAERSAQLADQCLQIAQNHPGTDEAVVALLWALANAPDTPMGKSALALARERLAEANLETLALCFGIGCGNIGPGWIPKQIRRELAPLLLQRVRQTPEHPKAAEVLCAVCSSYGGDDGAEVPAFFDEAAQIIAERWTTSPDLTHFLETLSSVRQRPWASRYESSVRSIQLRNPDAYIRYRAAFTLAQLVAETGEARQEEARDLYVRFVQGYQPGAVDPAWASVAESLVKEAKREIDGLLIRGIGGPAPDLKGLDLDGKPLALAAYRGKVVLLSFWATWCMPCMNLIPHERSLHENYKGRPFALIGVNGDKPDELDHMLLEANPVLWPSFQDRRPDQKTIQDEWKIAAWPTLFLIDHTGKIRRRWIGAPPMDELDREVERWVAVAEGKPLTPLPISTGKATPAKLPKGLPAKFIAKVFTDSQGRESKYTVCVPENDDAQAPLPVVLFLHGSGQVGVDNKEQLEIGLGPAIRANGLPFAFIGVFPQAGDSNWLAESADGKRALAILAEVERAFATHRSRVYLTGVSMGGAGVWSLAAAHPKRFAAIVPICGCGPTKLAEALKDVPCWAFHGDADKVVHVQDTRDLVEAITNAGGRPLYQEYRGVDHNCWDRAYADPELYKWLQAQKLK